MAISEAYVLPTAYLGIWIYGSDLYPNATINERRYSG